MACENTEDRAMAAGHSVDPAQWRGLLDARLARVAGRFARVEPLRTVAAPFGVIGMCSCPVATEPAPTPDLGFSAHPLRRSTEQLSESLAP